jgi:hypothetical protein
MFLSSLETLKRLIELVIFSMKDTTKTPIHVNKNTFFDILELIYMVLKYKKY